MSKWDGKSRGNVAGYKILIFLLKIAGPIPVYLILYPVTFYYFLFSRRTFRPTYAYFRRIHKFSVLKSLWGVYRNYYSLGVSLIDKIAVYSRDKIPFQADFDGGENLRAFFGGTSGGILLSAHAGSWEMAGRFLEKYNRKVHIVLLDAENERIRTLMEHTMVKMKDNPLLDRIPMQPDSMEHIFHIREALDKGEMICMHADRYLDGNRTVTMDFMGHPAEFPAGPFQLAAMFGVPLTLIFGFKKSTLRYQFYGIKAIQPEAGENKKEYAARALQMYTSELEKMVKKYPYQWYNFFYFWNR